MNKVDFVNSNTGYVVRPVGSVYKTTNFGITWNMLDFLLVGIIMK